MRVAMISFSLLSCALFVDAERLPTEATAFVEMVSSGHMISKAATNPTPTNTGTAVSEQTEPVAASTGTAANTVTSEELPPVQQHIQEVPAVEPVAASTGTASAVDENAIEVKATQPQFDIAKEGSELKKLPALFAGMKEKFKNAADKVWTGGDEKKADNFIQKTGLDWMNNVQKFRHTAGEMRQHAEDVYDDIVKSHTVAAKKQMRTFKEEMSKLKKVHEEHSRIAEEAKKVGTSGAPETSPESGRQTPSETTPESGAASGETSGETHQETVEKPQTEAEKKQQAVDACAEVTDVHCRNFRNKRNKYKQVPDDYTCLTHYTCVAPVGSGKEDFGPVNEPGDCMTKSFTAKKTVCGAQKL